MATRRAVITGIGVISPIGLDLDSYWQSLVEGKSGVKPIAAFDSSALPVRIAGSIPEFDAKKFIDKKDRKSLKTMARTIQLAVSAAQLALTDSGIDKDKLDPFRFGVEFGAGLIASEMEDLGDAAQVSKNCRPDHVDMEKWGDEGLKKIEPLWMLKYLPNMLACQVSIMHNAQGPNNSITQDEVAGVLALGEAYRIMGRGLVDYFLVGGADSRLSPLSMVRQSLFEHCSKRNAEPTKASRPFDKNRDGMVVGEGSAVLALEDLDYAQKRGAKIYAELVGFGSAFDRERTGAGLARAIKAALKEANIQPADIDHVNAAGYSTVEADIWEARALKEVFGDLKTPVFAAKSYFGNLGAGSGTTEMVASLLALKHGQVPATLNYEEADPSCPVNVSAKPRKLEKPYFLKIGFTEMGQCGAAVLRRWNG